MKKGLLIFYFVTSICLLSVECSFHNPNNEKIKQEAGHYLFFDKRLSFNNTKACSSCHDPALAFTDGYHRSIGANGDLHKRNSPTLLNISDNPYFTYSDSTIHQLHQQVQIPLFNTQFIELGTLLKKEEILSQINNDPIYQNFQQKEGKGKYEWNDIRENLAAYCKGLLSFQSKYDRVVRQEAAFTPDENEGAILFSSTTLGCRNCHGGQHFNTPISGNSFYANNGFYAPDSSHVNRKFSTDKGLFELTNKPSDIGQFKIPTLRNCVLTAPYMHDGSINTLDSVLVVYAQGGNHHANKHPFITGFPLSGKQKNQLIQFLQTLTDTSYLDKDYFKDPF